MLIAAALSLALATPAPPSSQRDEVRRTVLARHGQRTDIYSILIKGSYALVQGKSLHEGLQNERGAWHIVCTLDPGTAQPAQLQQRCKFPLAIAEVMSVEEPVNVAAAQGQFSTAAAAEQKAYASASTGPIHDSERARLQLLTQLNEQMRVQAITRDQAIQQWSQLRYSWSLP